MTTRGLLIGWAIAFAVAAGGCTWLLVAYAPGLGAGSLFLEAGLIPKFCMMLVLPLGLLAVIGGLTKVRLLAWIAAFGAGLFGALGAAYVEMTVQQAISRIGPVSFAVTSISHAEALFTLAFGLFPGVLALVALWFRERGAAR